MAKKVKNVDVRKLNQEQISALIEKYTAAGWTVSAQWGLELHQFLEFIWESDEEPPEM